MAKREGYMISRRNLLMGAAAVPLIAAAKPELVSTAKIWDAGQHNAFTDLIYHKGRYFCAFREGAGHVSPTASIRVLSSKDGAKWESAALLDYQNGDLRDPKLTVNPAGQLMLTTAVALRFKDPVEHQSLLYVSDEGKNWSAPRPIGDVDFWLWRVSWRGREEGLSIGYATGAQQRFIRLYRTKDGLTYETLVDRLFDDGFPNESAIHFASDGTAWCLLRRDGGDKVGLLGQSKPPYKDWLWKSLGVRIGGPAMISGFGGDLMATVRLYEPKVRTVVCRVDTTKPALEELVELPSGGDTSYAGMVYRREMLVSYYSSHEGKTSIYMAKLKAGK